MGVGLSVGETWRTSASTYDFPNDLYFPKPSNAFGYISIPIYLILLNYLAFLLLTWLLLMNRLARQDFQNKD